MTLSEKINLIRKKINHYLPGLIILILIYGVGPIEQLISYLSEKYLPSFFGIFTLIFLIILLIWIKEVSRKNFNEITASRFKKGAFHKYIPLIILMSGFWQAVIAFGALTSCLYDYGIIQIKEVRGKNDYADFADFYFWHGLDLIPAFKINEIFHFQIPITYNKGQLLLEWLLVFFKIIIVWLIIAQAYEWNKWRKEKDAKEAASKIPESMN